MCKEAIVPEIEVETVIVICNDKEIYNNIRNYSCFNDSYTYVDPKLNNLVFLLRTIDCEKFKEVENNNDYNHQICIEIEKIRSNFDNYKLRHNKIIFLFNYDLERFDYEFTMVTPYIIFFVKSIDEDDKSPINTTTTFGQIIPTINKGYIIASNMSMTGNVGREAYSLMYPFSTLEQTYYKTIIQRSISSYTNFLKNIVQTYLKHKLSHFVEDSSK